MTILILYASIEGHTAKIARYIEDLARNDGHTVRILDGTLKKGSVDLAGVERVILAASVHRKRHPAEFEKLVSSLKNEFDKRLTLFLSVSLCAGFPEGIEEAQSYLDDMSERTGFVADSELLVGGAIQLEKYRDYEAWIIRSIALGLKHYEAAHEDRDLTDWSQLRTTVSHFLRNTHRKSNS